MPEPINTQCQHCAYFTFDVPPSVYNSPFFKEGVHGACIGCPNSPPHVEHKESARCFWFVSRERVQEAT